MNPLEAFADAIQDFEGWRPRTLSYRHRNPGNLEYANGEKKIYKSFIDGYKDLLTDLEAKFTGHNDHGLGPESTVIDLFNIYAPSSDHNPTRRYAVFVCNWATLALGTDININTKLGDIYQCPSSSSSPEQETGAG